METITKKTREVGTSSGVLLPRKWLNKEVIVTLLEKSQKRIAKDVLEILFKKNLNEEIKGIYLVGSYARDEQDANSDIDVLVITQNTSKLINHENYEILLIPEKNFKKNLPNNLNYLSMLKEAESLVNKGLIKKYSSKKYSPNFKRNLEEIKNIMDINKESVEIYGELNKNVSDGVIYSIILRLRELYLIKCLISNKKYYKKKFMQSVNKKTYDAYLRIKRNEKEKNVVSVDEAKKLLSLYKEWLKEIKD